MRVAAHIERTETDRPGLERWLRSRRASVRWRERSQMGLRAAEGRANQAMAQARGTDPNQVGRWRRHLAEQGLEGMVKERPRGSHHGGPCSKAQAELRSQVIRRTTPTEPPDATHWSCRSRARAAGTTHSFVHRVGRSCGLKPHRVRTFQVSRDPHFGEKLQDGVGR